MTEVETRTVQILREIRDEVRSTRVELSSRIDQTNSRLDQVEHALVDLAEQQRFLVHHAKALTERDRRIELDVDKLAERVDAIEDRLGSR